MDLYIYTRVCVCVWCLHVCVYNSIYMYTYIYIYVSLSLSLYHVRIIPNICSSQVSRKQDMIALEVLSDSSSSSSVVSS